MTQNHGADIKKFRYLVHFFIAAMSTSKSLDTMSTPKHATGATTNEGSTLKNRIILENTVIPKNTTITSKKIIVIDNNFLRDGGYIE